MEFGREPSHEELANALCVSSNRLSVVLSASLDPISLDRELRGGSGSVNDARTLADVIPTAQPDPQAEVEQRLMRQTLARSLHPHLSADEHAVICSCYNLIEDRKSPLTYAEIAKRFCKSVQWVSKVEARALKKLKGRPQLRNLLQTRDLTANGWEYDAA